MSAGVRGGSRRRARLSAAARAQDIDADVGAAAPPRPKRRRTGAEAPPPLQPGGGAAAAAMPGGGAPQAPPRCVRGEAAQARWARVCAAFPALESAYFCRRSTAVRRAGAPGRPAAEAGVAVTGAPAAAAAAGGGTAPDAPAPGAPAAQAGMGEHLSSFLTDLSKFALHTRLKARTRAAAPPACAARLMRSVLWRLAVLIGIMPCVPHGPECGQNVIRSVRGCTPLQASERGARPQVTATLRFGDVLQAADMVCSTAFDRDDDFFATAGVSRRIKARRRAPVAPAAGVRLRVLCHNRVGAQGLRFDCGEGELCKLWSPELEGEAGADKVSRLCRREGAGRGQNSVAARAGSDCGSPSPRPIQARTGCRGGEGRAAARA